MAKNRVYTEGKYLGLVCTFPAVPVSGDPVLVGEMPGVAETNENASDGVTSVDLGPAVYTLLVSAVGAGVAVGDRLFASKTSPVVVSNTNTGVPFGFALGTVTNGASGAINVKIQGSTRP